MLETVGRVVERIEDIDFLSKLFAAGGGDGGKLGLGVEGEHAAPVKKQVPDQRHRLAGARSGHRQDVAVILDPDELVAERADQDFCSRIIRVV